MTEVRIYIEGGGTGNDTKTKLRQGFNNFLRTLKDLAKERQVGWTVVTCGSRREAFDDFRSALKMHPDSLNVLLVDSEGPLPANVRETGEHYWDYLKVRDDWDRPPTATDQHCFLMVQCMETWIVADRAALKNYYGQGFNEKALPKHANLEEVPKDKVLTALQRATSGTKTKGQYDKSAHGFDLMLKLNSETVRAALPSCERLFSTITTLITGNQ